MMISIIGKPLLLELFGAGVVFTGLVILAGLVWLGFAIAGYH